MAVQPHPWNPTDDGYDCQDCWLARGHSIHATERRPLAAARLDAPDARVRLDAPLTSHEAARKSLPRVGTTKRAIFVLIANRPYGCTDDELEVLLDKTHQSVSAARNSLCKDPALLEPLLDETGRHVTRKTRSDHDAYVWTLTPYARTLRADLEGRSA